ncbi:MAG: EamA family transporter [Candidatus Aminicenantes bacterium]|nr:EamA family transporter [Candidatus Aminicenantes bacterium]
MTSRSAGLGILAMVATAFLWSIAGLFIKVIDWHPLTIAGFRSLIASFVVLLYVRRPHIHLSFPQVAATVCNAATMILFVAANKTTTSANAIILQYIAPVCTAFVGAWLLKEKTRLEHWIAIILVTAGIVVMFMDKLGGGQMLGNIFSLLSGITFSFYFVFMRMQKDGSPIESILLSHWLVSAIGLTATLFLPAPHFTLKAVRAIAVLGIFQIGVAAILFVTAIKRISAISANLIAVIEPVFNPLWVFLALGETPGTKALIGGAVIIAAVTGASIISARRATLG